MFKRRTPLGLSTFYKYKEYGKQGKLTYISKKDFKKRFRKVIGF